MVLSASKQSPKARSQPVKVMSDWKDRITFNPNQCGGRPCIRGMRIRVTDVLDLLAAGHTTKEILAELPDLESEDIEASIRYARGNAAFSTVGV